MTATIGKPYSKYKDYAESYHVAGTRKEDSQWRGLLAHKLGYDGSINQFAYDLACEGKDSYGRQLRKYQKNSRPAICDVTLNAPKSLSVEALVYSNPVAVAAHDFGVENALAFTEQHLLFSQVKHQGKVERVHTQRALIGSFRQRDNREGEPHLHTHNVIFNVGWVEGKWRSLANEQIYLGKLTIGAIYQNDTAYHLHQAGYKTYWDANGQFELAGNPKRLLEQTFAQRTEKIEAYLAQRGLDRSTATPEQLNAANRATRNKKAYDLDATAQVKDWQSTAATTGIIPCQKVSQQELECNFSCASNPVNPQEIVLAAAERLSEKRSTFGYMELVREGCRLSAGRYLSSEVIKAIQQSRELIPVTSNTPYPNYTTHTILRSESQIIDWTIQGKSAYATISDSNKAAVVAEKFTLNSDQTLALQHIATSQDLITLIQGSAGVGKTRSLAALLDLMSERPIIGCAVGGLQAEALEADSGIPSQTIESLIRTPIAEFPQSTLIVVDEAGVVSNRQMHQLIERAKSSNSRLLLVGDTKQLSAVETGNPFGLLQTRAGLETAFISQNMRQKDEQLKAVVDLCEELRPAEAFDLLEKQGKIREIPHVDQLSVAIVDDYLTRPLEQRRNTLIMATTHKERTILTQAIRNKLVDTGELLGSALEIEVLHKKDLDKHELTMVDHYQVGDMVRFWRKGATFTKGSLYRVSAANPEGHSVELVDTLGQTKTLDLYRYTDREVFSPQRIEIRAGEEMRFTAGIKDKNGKQLQVNGQRFRVEAIDNQTQTIEISTKGKRLTVTPFDLLHSDYRWISTVHSLQGATAQYAIFAAGQGNGALLSRESWYVAASRAKLEFAVYCGDQAQLRESIQRSIAQRPAIDLIDPSISTSIQEKAVQAIVDYVQQQEISAALTPELLKTLTETLHQFSEVTKTAQQVNNVAFWDERLLDIGQPDISKSIQDLAVQAIFDYLQQQEVEAALTSVLLKTLTETLNQHNDQSQSVIAPTHKNPSPELLAAQFQILTDQLLAADAVYQEQGLRMERSSEQITASIQGTEVDIHKPENLAILVNHLQALLHEFELNSLYEEFRQAARLEKSIEHLAAEIFHLNSGNYYNLGLSVENTTSDIQIKLDQNLIFRSHQGIKSRPDDLLLLENLEQQLQSSITDLQQTIEAKLKQKEAMLEAESLKALRELTNTSTIEKQQKSTGHGLTL